MDNRSNFIRGSVELLVLQILSEGECFGTQISELIEEYSDGIISLPVGTLYPTFYRLEEKGYIEVEQRIVNRRLRTYYHILDSGKKYYKSTVEEYKLINKGVQSILDRKNRKE